MRYVWTCRFWMNETEAFESRGWSWEQDRPSGEPGAHLNARIDAVAAIMRGARKVEIAREAFPE